MLNYKTYRFSGAGFAGIPPRVAGPFLCKGATMYEFIFGVFRSGNLIMSIGNKVTCNHNQAAVIVGLLNCALNATLEPGDYVASDYTKEPKP